MPIIFVIAGLTGGLAILLATSLGDDADRVMTMVNTMLISLVAYAVFMAIYLWVSTYESSAARDSVMRMIRGSIALAFWIGVVLLGMIIPIALLATNSVTGASAALIITAAICAIIGGVALRYIILKAGMYSPLVPAE